MKTSDDSVRETKEIVKQTLNELGALKSPFLLGIIDPAYSGTGRPKVILDIDGGTTVTQKQYQYLSSYTPAAGDRVELALVSGSYIIQGKIL